MNLGRKQHGQRMRAGIRSLRVEGLAATQAAIPAVRTPAMSGASRRTEGSDKWVPKTRPRGSVTPANFN